MSFRVLHVRSTIGMYGAEKVVLNLLQSAAKLDYQYSLFCIEGMNPQSRLLAQAAAGYAHKTLACSTDKRLDKKIIQRIRTELAQYDVVHTHDYKSLIYVCLARGFRTQPKIFHHVHGALGNTRMERIYAHIEKLLMRMVSGVITVSDVQQQMLAAQLFAPRWICQIDNGTALNALNKKAAGHTELKLVMAARFTAEKNHYLAVDVIQALAAQGVQVHLTCLGDGPLQDEIKHYAQTRGVLEKMYFAGFVNNVTHYLQDADALLITSHTEGMPMAMLEAMAAGVPVVSTPVGQIPHIIRRAQCGATADNLAGLVQALVQLSTASVAVQAWGENARAYIQQHCSVEKQLHDIHAFYAQAGLPC